MLLDHIFTLEIWWCHIHFNPMCSTLFNTVQQRWESILVEKVTIIMAMLWTYYPTTHIVCSPSHYLPRRPVSAWAFMSEWLAVVLHEERRCIGLGNSQVQGLWRTLLGLQYIAPPVQWLAVVLHEECRCIGLGNSQVQGLWRTFLGL